MLKTNYLFLILMILSFSCNNSKKLVKGKELRNQTHVLEIDITNISVDGIKDEHDTKAELAKDLLGFFAKRTIVYNNEKLAIINYDDQDSIKSRIVYNSLDTSFTILTTEENQKVSKEVIDAREMYGEELLKRSEEELKKDTTIFIEKENVEIIHGLKCYNMKLLKPKTLFEEQNTQNLYITDDLPFVNNTLGNIMKMMFGMIIQMKMETGNTTIELGVISREIDESMKYLLDI